MKKYFIGAIVSLSALLCAGVLFVVNFFKIQSIFGLIGLGLWRAKKLTFGDEVVIRNHVVIRHPERVIIGSRVAINEFTHIWGGGGVEIGTDTMIASHCVITSQTHSINGVHYRETLERKPVFIGDNVWVGAGAIILPGVRIGNNSVVGAGSVVTKDVPENCVVAGVPATIIRHLL